MLEKLIENKSSQSIQFELIEGEQQEMKFRGITIKKHKTCNTWYARYRADGKQFYVSAKTQQDCYNKLKAALKKQEQKKLKLLKEPKQKEPKTLTLLSWFKKWIELYKQDVRQTTIDDYNSSFKFLIKIQNKEINKITGIEILENLNAIPYSRRKQKTYELLKAVFQKAKLNKLIEDNPLDAIEKPKHKKTNGLAFSNSDEEKIIKILKDRNLDCFLICLYQGLRKGEMLALTNEDLDFEARTIRINKSMSQNGVIGETKNIYSNRIMPMFNKTYDILIKYKNVQGRIFTISRGSSEDKFLDIIKTNFNKKYTIHSLRHTFITKCQEAGIPLHIIQKWVGHNIGSEVTAKVYTHLRESAELENIEKLNNYN